MPRQRRQSAAGVVTCWAHTSYGVDQDFGYYAWGGSQTYDQWGPISVDFIQVVTHGTNIAHSGETFDYSSCYVYNGSACTNGIRYYCDAGGVVCGENDLYNWYATTHHYYYKASWSLEYVVYTVSTSSYGRESGACFFNMNCF